MHARKPLIPPIHFRTRYSLLAGVFSPEEICSLAESSGSPFVGIADLGNMYALPRFLNAAAARGLSPLVGACVEKEGSPLFTAYCLNAVGFERMNGILTRLLAAPREPPGAVIRAETLGYRPGAVLPAPKP